MEAIVEILKQKIGLNPSSIGESSIRRAIQHCMSLNHIQTFDVYAELLRCNDAELKRLIEEIVVAETWFFRNPTQFKVLESFVIKELLPSYKPGHIFRLLSVPCSTGEEPYSIAIVLREAGIASDTYEITGMDISQRSINTALSATYSRNSFRDTDKNILGDYFITQGRQFQLVSLIRNRVEFMLANILEKDLPREHFDAIFCRNLLIYFDRKNQQNVLSKLYSALKPDGVLFVGHAESAHVPSSHFDQLSDHHAFAFRKKETVASVNMPSISSNVSGQWADVFEKISKIDTGTEPLRKQATGNRPMLHSLVPAEKLAHEGKYNEAENMCYEFLRHIPDSAQANFLLGLIKSYQNEIEKAEKFLKKAVYLDPNHEAALSLLLDLAQRRGDEEAITSYSRRVSRVKNRNLGSSE